ncbi:MAG: DUF2306 domain-containing protein [Steroidobacteraceae bacterium]|nr:DUF2306 domain-containing protein [Steroidobacteraceae bacterium]
MNESVLSVPLPNAAAGIGALRVTSRVWFLIAVAGQWLFAAYVASFYGGVALTGDLSGWNAELPRGYVEGQVFENFVVGAHLALAFVVLVCGPLQFSRALRTRLPRLHRMNGRVYILTAMITSLAGVYMIATRGTVGDGSLHMATSFNALLILSFAALAWRSALQRDFEMHRVWVMRLWLAVGGVWFFRVGFMFWVAWNQGPVGFDMKTFSGPAITILGFAQTLLPLAVLQLYLLAERSNQPLVRYAVAAVIGAATFVTGFGLFAAANKMWLPHL